MSKNSVANKLVPIISYEKIKISPYEFDEMLIEQQSKVANTTPEEDLFIRDRNGSILGLNKEVYKQAAVRQYKKFLQELKSHE